MGGAQSHEEPTHGLHILSVLPDTNAENAGIELYFDYITHINNSRVSETVIFPSTPVNLVIFNTRTLKFRQVVTCAPLGAKAKYCKIISDDLVTFKILDVAKGSPGEEAGLKEGEYFIHSPTTSIRTQAEFAKALQLNKLLMHVYNVEDNNIREVLICPREWNGSGRLGCDIGIANCSTHHHGIAVGYKEYCEKKNLKQNNEKDIHNVPLEPVISEKVHKHHNGVHSQECNGNHHDHNHTSDKANVDQKFVTTSPNQIKEGQTPREVSSIQEQKDFKVVSNIPGSSNYFPAPIKQDRIHLKQSIGPGEKAEAVELRLKLPASDSKEQFLSPPNPESDRNNSSISASKESGPSNQNQRKMVNVAVQQVNYAYESLKAGLDDEVHIKIQKQYGSDESSPVNVVQLSPTFSNSSSRYEYVQKVDL